MAKRGDQKEKLLILWQLLLAKSDEDHPIPTARLIEALEREGIAAERKSVYDDMEALRRFGLDVQCRREKPGGWFIGQRDFQLPELKLLVDAVQSSRFISHRKSETLIRKLEGLTSEAQARQLRRQVYVDRRLKTENEQVYYAIDKLHTAIGSNRAVSFRYFEYNVRKERVFHRNGEKYAVSPYGLIWADENYYLVGWAHREKELRHYRVDRMEGLAITRGVRQGDESCRSFDLAQYGRRHFHMFSGTEAQVRLRCVNRLVNVILERFGMETILIPDGPDHFTATVPAVVSDQFYGWVFGLGGGARITAPDWVVEDYQKRLRAALEE